MDEISHLRGVLEELQAEVQLFLWVGGQDRLRKALAVSLQGADGWRPLDLPTEPDREVVLPPGFVGMGGEPDGDDCPPDGRGT